MNQVLAQQAPMISAKPFPTKAILGAGPTFGFLLDGRNILVVEDEMLILMNAEDILFDLGCRNVLAAATVQQALDLIESEPIDAALLDVNLNGARSHAIADVLADRGIPFAYSTGYGANGLRDADRGCPLLIKPYGVDELGEMMRSLLDL
jgi:CheY-like chemotaxis protein